MSVQHPAVACPPARRLDCACWRAGAHAEADARNDGMSKAARDVRACLEAAAALRPEASEAELATLLAEIYTAELSWWRRLRLAMT